MLALPFSSTNSPLDPCHHEHQGWFFIPNLPVTPLNAQHGHNAPL